MRAEQCTSLSAGPLYMLKKIKVTDLEVGMHLHEFCGSWMEHPFWRTKFVITDPNDIRLVQASSIKEVWIDVKKGKDTPNSSSAQEVSDDVDQMLAEAERASMRSEATAPTKFSDEAKRAAKICSMGKEAVISMFQEARMGKAITEEAATNLVNEITDSVTRNPGALISLARLRSADDYTYMHSVAVCALMIALAKQLGLDDKQTREAGMAGLLHDLGKAMMPMEVLNKPGKLTDQEFAIIKSHPVEGHKLLLEGGGASAATLDVCLHHHEKTDGSGYPEKLTADSISLLAKMGAVCDVYDAITSNRPYKTGWDPAESIRKMGEWCKGHFDERVFQAFVKSIGIYPTGSLIKLTSGRLAVVIEQSEKSLLAPKVKVFFSTKAKAYITPEIIDLSKPGPEKIVSREDANAWGLKDIDRFWTTG